MEKIKDLFPKNLYHSYIVEGDPSTLPYQLKDFFEKRGDIEKNSNDVLCQIYDSFTIDDSSKIKEWHSEKGLGNGKRMCILGAKFINHDAERTLLKIIEEPGENVHFFIIVPNANLLLDTIISRSHIISTDGPDSTYTKKDIESFIKSSPKDRLEIVAKIIDSHKDSEGSGSIRFSATKFINEIEKIIYEKWKSNRDNDLQFSLTELSSARDYLSLPGSSPKMILEHISLVL